MSFFKNLFKGNKEQDVKKEVRDSETIQKEWIENLEKEAGILKEKEIYGGF